jgi:hypothetical protein
MKIYQKIILFLSIGLCGCLASKSISIDDKIIENNPNLIETSPNYYLEFIGLKNFTAQQIVDSMRVKQSETIIGARVLNACSAVMESALGFEYSSTNYVRPNYGYITLIESKQDYGIIEKAIPKDTVATYAHWNIEGKDLSIFANKTALHFLIQFLRTDGEKLSMKMKIIYNQYAEDSEKKFSDGLIDHINSLDMAESLPLARQTLKSDGNLVNRYWAMLIMMRTVPNDEDLKLLFDQYYYDDNRLKSYNTFILRETLKLRDNITWNSYSDEIQNLINGSAIWDYDTILNFFTDNEIDPKIASDILNPASPILQDYLNAYESRKSETALKFIKRLSSEEVKNKVEANQWLATQYQKSQK